MSSDVPDLAGARENVGTVRQAQESGTYNCSGGGTLSATGDESSANIRYNNCSESGCSINGTATIFSSGAGE